MNLDILIEALLFYKAAPQNKQKLTKLFAVPDEELAAALQVLKARLAFGATRIVETENDIQLVTAPDLSTFIESLRKQDLTGDIGKAGAETLAIIVYREPVSRAEIDSIRGVNSQTILRNLLTRGLIIREPTTNGGYQFRISSDLLRHLGVTSKKDLPEFPEFMAAIDSFNTINHG
jgi:segregation and condensation protein B